MSRIYNCKPSEIMHLENEYDAFCFDEACAYIILEMEQDDDNKKRKEPRFTKEYSNFADLYKNLERNGVKCQ